MMDERGEDTFDTAFVKLKDIFLNADFYYDLAQLYKLFRGRSNTRPTDAKSKLLRIEGQAKPQTLSDSG